METTYYHGTCPRNIYAILTQGFKMGEGQHGRVHGEGLYIATKPETAAYWSRSGYVQKAQYAFKCHLQQGTKILWKDVNYDMGVIRYLERKFGKQISRNTDFWKYIPRNKRLTNAELRALVSHLDYTTTRKAFSWSGARKREKIDDIRYANLSRFSKMIRQYGYDAFGDRTFGCWDCDEILVYNPSRVVPVSLHRIDVEWAKSGWDPVRVDYSHPLSLEEAKKIADEEEADWQATLARWDAEDAARIAKETAEALEEDVA
jgi:hypothetical protein